MKQLGLMCIPPAIRDRIKWGTILRISVNKYTRGFPTHLDTWRPDAEEPEPSWAVCAHLQAGPLPELILTLTDTKDVIRIRGMHLRCLDSIWNTQAIIVVTSTVRGFVWWHGSV